MRYDRRMFRGRFFAYRRRVTRILIATNILVYVLVSLAGALLLSLRGDYVKAVFALLVPDFTGAIWEVHRIVPIVLQGYEVMYLNRWWELLTSMFVHANLLHILFNMLALKSIGEVTEVTMGTKRMLIAYFLGGLVGGVLTITIAPFMYTVGASGAIFSIIGLLAMFEYKRFGSMRSINWAIMIFIISSFGFGGEVVNVLAHIGGLATGLALGFIWAISIPRIRFEYSHTYYPYT